MTTDISDKQALCIRKHCGVALRNVKLPQNLENFESHSLTWRQLNDARANLRKIAQNLYDGLSDDPDETRAAEIEEAFNGLMTVHDEVQGEIDHRGKIGNKEPRSSDSITGRPEYPEGAVRGDGTPVYRGFEDGEVYALRPEQRMVDLALQNGASHPDLSLGRYFRAMTLGARNDAERRALAEGTDSAGGYTVPEILQAEMIDLLRARTVAVRAGARTVNLTTDRTTVAKVLSDPDPGFRAEAGEVNESDPTFGQVVFEPKSLAVLVKVSRELLEDSLNIETELPRIITAAMAAKVDRVVLFGSGSGDEPEGLANDSGIETIALDGELSSYSPLNQARTRILTANAEPSAFVMHPREDGTLADLTATDNQPLQMPRSLQDINMLTTTAVPTDGGTGDNESSILAGDFNNLLIGIRNQLRIEVLRERYASTLQYGYLAHLRLDTARTHSGTFVAITGIQPAA